MARGNWIWDSVTNKLVTKEQYQKLQQKRIPSKKYDMPDIIQAPIGGRWRYDKEQGKCVEITSSSSEPKPQVFIQTDEIPPTESMATADRAMFTSKKKLEEYDRRHGFVHTGGDHLTGKAPTPPKPDPREIREDVERSLNALRYNQVPLTEREKETCKREERAYQDWKRKNRLH